MRVMIVYDHDGACVKDDRQAAGAARDRPPAESFLVTKDNQLRPGEQDRAGQWGRKLAALLPTARPTG